MPRETRSTSSLTVAVTGGAGFIGSHLRVALHDNPVILLGRREPRLLSHERQVYMDMADSIPPDMLGRADVLCHLAYAAKDGRRNILYNRRLLDAVNAQPNIRQVVLFSSASVYGASVAHLVDEESPCRPAGQYAETKLACETVWRDGLREGCDLIVLRPTEVIGPGGRGLLTLIRDALHRPVVAAIKRSLLYHRPLHYVAVRNVVAAILFCFELPLGSAREIYVVSDDHQPENESYAIMQDTVRNIAGRKALPGFAMPRWTLPFIGALGRRTLEPKQSFSSRKLHEAGFEDEVSLFDEVERLVQSIERTGTGDSMHGRFS